MDDKSDNGAATSTAETFMKTILFFGYGAALVVCVIGDLPWPARLALSGAAIFALLHRLSQAAPVGYQDEDGFHYSRPRRRRKDSFTGSWFSPASRALKA